MHVFLRQHIGPTTWRDLVSTTQWKPEAHLSYDSLVNLLYERALDRICDGFDTPAVHLHHGRADVPTDPTIGGSGPSDDDGSGPSAFLIDSAGGKGKGLVHTFEITKQGKQWQKKLKKRNKRKESGRNSYPKSGERTE